ncbi:MAG TPA: YbaK/EbsC family protein [Thermoleophilaceae bacterium]|nr:YbaK/EbsC family protein [Thermoleophilaceae bacterium]
MRSKVIDSARDLGLDVNVQRLPDTRASVADTAAAVGCGAARIASCTVYVADGDPIVCVASAGCPVDADLLADALDVAEVRLASSGETRAATGFAISGVPPFGHGLPVVVDEVLLTHSTVWAAGGDGSTLVEIEPRRLASCTAATVAAVTAVTA